MPSYADEYAALHPRSQMGSSGPVRLTISRGDSVQGANGQYTYIEKWEQEEIMDMEVTGPMDDEAAAIMSQLNAHDPERPLLETVLKRLPNGRGIDVRFHGYSLLVLDTNVLLSTLQFLMTFFSQCLSRNVFALSDSTFPPSPIALVIPHTVLSELDNLKTSSRGNVATAAREANRWILSALQNQKKQMYDVFEQGQTRRETIPESSWVLHIENTAHTSALQQVHGPLSAFTPDEEIVRLCVSLKKQAGLDVFFCSDDINARTRAEVDGLPTFSFRELVMDERGNEVTREKLVQLAADLIEQWHAQIQGSTDHQGDSFPDRMEEDEQIVDEEERRQIIQRQNFGGGSLNNTAKKTTQHSNHAIINNASAKHSENQYSAKSRNSRVRTSLHGDRSQLQSSTITSTNHSHQYPNDRSTSSSMWAIQP